MSESMLNNWDQPESEDRLELVFDGRFKGYGAYFVRTKYRQSKFIATVVACCFVVLLAATPVIIEKFKGSKKSGSSTVRVQATTLEEAIDEKEEEKPLEPVKPEKPEPVASQQYVAPTIDPNAQREDELPPMKNITNPGQKTQEGKEETYGDEDEGGMDPNKGSGDDGPAPKVDVQAQFPGGDEAFIAYVTEKFQYPPRCHEEGINGYVLLRFVVDGKGNISNISALEGTASCPEFTDEAKRVLKKSPRWIPAQYNGKFVKAWRQIPIRLSIE